MEINSKIIEILKEYNIFAADGICYLIAIFHGYHPTFIPDDIKKKINLTGIVVEKDGSVHWNIPLYKGQETAFEWVKTEYEPMFKNANPDKGGHVREATKRIKSLFSKHPEIRKEDVIGATRMYISNTNPKFIRLPHFFIEKGRGVSKINDILDWIDKYKLTKDQQVGRNSVTNTMQ